MADDSDGYVNGVTLDLIFKFMDEDILDGEFDDETTQDIKEVRNVKFCVFYIEKKHNKLQ